jgi:hypothetical protein
MTTIAGLAKHIETILWLAQEPVTTDTAASEREDFEI